MQHSKQSAVPGLNKQVHFEASKIALFQIFISCKHESFCSSFSGDRVHLAAPCRLLLKGTLHYICPVSQKT